MPQKRNPVAIEHIRVQASVVIGLCDTVITAMHNTPFADMNDAEDPIQIVGFDAFAKARRCLKLFTGFVQGLQVDEKKVQQHMVENFVTVTELADSLVRQEGLSFRAAHEIASLLVKDLLARQKNLQEVNYADFAGFFEQVTGKKTQVTPKVLLEILDPAYFVQTRNCLGGPARPALEKSLAGYKKQKEQAAERLKDLAWQEEKAHLSLEKEIRKVMAK